MDGCLSPNLMESENTGSTDGRTTTMDAIAMAVALLCSSTIRAKTNFEHLEKN